MGKVVTETGIAFTNSSGGTVVDPIGVVSTTQFTLLGTNVTADQTISGTALENLTNVTLTTSDLSRSVNSLILFTAQYAVFSNASFTGHCRLRLALNGTLQPGVFIAKNAARDTVTGEQIQNLFSTSTTHYVVPLPSGIGTLQMQGQVVNTSGTCEVTLYESNFSCLLLGN